MIGDNVITRKAVGCLVVAWAFLATGCAQSNSLSKPERHRFEEYQTLVFGMERPELAQQIVPQYRQQVKDVFEAYARYNKAKHAALALVRSYFGSDQATTLEKASKVLVENNLRPGFLGALATPSSSQYHVLRKDGTTLIYRQNDRDGITLVELKGQYLVSRGSWGTSDELAMLRKYLDSVADYLENFSLGIQDGKINKGNIGHAVVYEWKGGGPPPLDVSSPASPELKTP